MELKRVANWFIENNLLVKCRYADKEQVTESDIRQAKLSKDMVVNKVNKIYECYFKDNEKYIITNTLFYKKNPNLVRFN